MSKTSNFLEYLKETKQRFPEVELPKVELPKVERVTRARFILQKQRVKGDGDCLFHSVATILTAVVEKGIANDDEGVIQEIVIDRLRDLGVDVNNITSRTIRALFVAFMQKANPYGDYLLPDLGISAEIEEYSNDPLSKKIKEMIPEFYVTSADRQRAFKNLTTGQRAQLVTQACDNKTWGNEFTLQLLSVILNVNFHVKEIRSKIERWVPTAGTAHTDAFMSIYLHLQGAHYEPYLVKDTTENKLYASVNNVKLNTSFDETKLTENPWNQTFSKWQNSLIAARKAVYRGSDSDWLRRFQESYVPTEEYKEVLGDIFGAPMSVYYTQFALPFTTLVSRDVAPASLRRPTRARVRF